jgi:hypothetical protein
MTGVVPFFIQEGCQHAYKRKGNKVKPAMHRYPVADDAAGGSDAAAEGDDNFEVGKAAQSSESEEEVVAKAVSSSQAPENNFRALIKQLLPPRLVQYTFQNSLDNCTERSMHATISPKVLGVALLKTRC